MKSFSFAILCILTIFSHQLFSQTDSADLKVFEKVDIDASFPGGDNAWLKFLQTHLNANVPVDKGAPAGKYTVWVQFIVDKEGNVTEINPLTHHGYGMEAEVIRILKLVPRWIPASQDGRLVKVYRKQPVTFIIEEDSYDIHFGSDNQVLFIGVDNPITVSAIKVKPQNLSVSVSKGTISGNEGNYSIRVNKSERTFITIYNKEKQIGEYSVMAVYPSAADTSNPIISNIEPQNLIWSSAAINPGFPGGEKEWKKFLQNTLNENVPINAGAPKGEYTVWVLFLVDKDGHASNWEALTKPGYGMEAEAISAIKKVSGWTPAIQGGQKVKCYLNVPVTFQVK